MPAVSKKQQRFFGMVRAAQKGEMENPSSEVLDVASDISMKDAKKFAKTKHKGLPEKKVAKEETKPNPCLLYTSPNPRDGLLSRMPSSA